MKLPDMPGTFEMTREVPDHEILLVFNGDDDASQFRDWLQAGGWESFLRWRYDQ